ncbi:hypothetical protein LTR37_005904 [Vermiconidia calcicola]|uniref:Uncharacterized protein n=1 Tax=Vermiconidia calcicola TaxID=1690605 RepID=A0ACC3NJA2_9PEZI|nr:hypothetical protein LTR37_005904 [Vermiconidia calcicola]
MISSRALARAPRAARAIRANAAPIKRSTRFASSTAAPETGAGSGAITGGLVGGAAALAVGYGFYHFSGAKSAVQTASQAKGYFDNATDSLKVKFDEKTPDTNQAIQTLRETANKYASFIPGGRGYVDSAFNDLESIRKKHGDEVDKIVSEAYSELRDVSKKGVSMDSARDTYNVLAKHVERLFSLAGDASEDIMNNHPELKEKLGGSTDQLKQLGERLGPEAKKQVDETWKEINDILQQGMRADTVMRVWTLVQEKTQQLSKMGEQAFNQGYEQIKPMLEKNPQVKKLVEDNMDTLKKGNMAEVVNQVKSAVSSGSTQDLEKYLQQAKEKTQQHSSQQLSGWLEMIPNGGQIMPQLMKLREVAQKHGDEAQNLAKETMEEIKKVLDKKVSEAEKLFESGKEDAKK